MGISLQSTVTNITSNYKMVSLVILLSCVLACVSAVEVENIADVSYGQTRQPKLFYVSSSSTTSSVSTATVCYKPTSAGVVACGKRRRRALIDTGLNGADVTKIQPKNSFGEEADSDPKLESGAEDPITSDRDGRFLLYWLTTTSTSTTTIYTGTSTIATLNCTPSGYTLNSC